MVQQLGNGRRERRNFWPKRIRQKVEVTNRDADKSTERNDEKTLRSSQQKAHEFDEKIDDGKAKKILH